MLLCQKLFVPKYSAAKKLSQDITAGIPLFFGRVVCSLGQTVPRYGEALNRTALVRATYPPSRVRQHTCASQAATHEVWHLSRLPLQSQSPPADRGVRRRCASSLDACEVERAPPEGVGKVAAVQMPAHRLCEEVNSHSFGHFHAGQSWAVALEVLSLLLVSSVTYPLLRSPHCLGGREPVLPPATIKLLHQHGGADVGD